jgi:hypothetical protein
MGTYTRHVIVVINSDNIEPDMKLLAETIHDVTNGYHGLDDLRDDFVFDDTSWNSGSGSKWYDFNEDIEKVSEILPNFDIYCWTECEDGLEYEFIIRNGVNTSVHTIGDSRYSYYDYNKPSEEQVHKGDFGSLVENSLKSQYVKD